MNFSIFDYTDYQEFLKDWYKAQKQEATSLSYQRISDIAGFKSKSYVQRVINGDASLSKKSVGVFAHILNLSVEESEYFEYLVLYKHAKKYKEKYVALRKIQERSYKLTQTLESKRFEYFNTWYHPVVREVCTSVRFDEDYLKLGRLLQPQITAKEAHDSVKLLLELGLIKKYQEGYLSEQSTVIAQQESEYLALRNYQKQLIYLASEAMDNIEPEERNIITITAGLSHQSISLINGIINNAQHQVVNIINEDQDSDKIMQINLQLFPLSKDVSEKSRYE